MPRLIHVGTEVIANFAVVSDENDIIDIHKSHFHLVQLTDASFATIKQLVVQKRSELEATLSMSGTGTLMQAFSGPMKSIDDNADDPETISISSI